MADKNVISAQGIKLNRLEKRLNIYQDEVALRLRAALLRGAEKVALRSRARVHSITGELVRKIKASQTKRNGNTYVRSRAFYSKSVEFGHKARGGGAKIPPAPFFFNEFNQEKPAIRADAVRAILGAKARI